MLRSSPANAEHSMARVQGARCALGRETPLRRTEVFVDGGEQVGPGEAQVGGQWGVAAGAEGVRRSPRCRSTKSLSASTGIGRAIRYP